jgi:hypothetical protein
MANTTLNHNPKGDKINAYVCEKLHITVTEDLHKGTTPMFISCPQCEIEHRQGLARTQMYKVDQSIQATYEWYKPTSQDLATVKAGMDAGMFSNVLTHVNQGGLLMRAKKTFKIWLPKK